MLILALSLWWVHTCFLYIIFCLLLYLKCFITKSLKTELQFMQKLFQIIRHILLWLWNKLNFLIHLCEQKENESKDHFNFQLASPTSHLATYALDRAPIFLISFHTFESFWFMLFNQSLLPMSLQVLSQVWWWSWGTLGRFQRILELGLKCQKESAIQIVATPSRCKNTEVWTNYLFFPGW